jgi:hypothetical protein
MNLLLVGGGFGAGEDFWSHLRSIELDGSEPIARDRLRPVMPDATPSMWQLRAVRTFPRDGWQQAVITRAVGPATRASADIYLDDAWRRASVYQQPNGLTQIFVEFDPSGQVEAFAVPMAA